MGIVNWYTRYYKNSKRLLFKSTKLPTNKELKATGWITAIGVLVIGAIGYVLFQIIRIITDPL